MYRILNPTLGSNSSIIAMFTYIHHKIIHENSYVNKWENKVACK